VQVDSKSRLIAEPKILVNDNATGRLESIQEEPFTSLNVGQAVFTTTFAGYAEAGLAIEVTPHISEGDFVVMEYTMTSRSFGDASTQPGIPPARSSDLLSSTVTVPDGYTAVVGGLTRAHGSHAVDKIPILGSIPIIGMLFRSTTDSAADARVFVFLRPVVLRDESFADLKGLSRSELLQSPKRAWGADGIYPPVTPRVIR
jgi:type II secretory pathway component GspD/PulD (secretin)